MKKAMLLGFLALLLLTSSGCLSFGGCLAASTVPLEPGDYTVLGPAEGNSWGFMIMGIPISEPTQAANARDRAIRAGGGDALINVSASTKLYMLVFVNIMKTTVRGEAVKMKDPIPGLSGTKG